MCGIIAYKGSKNASEIIIEGLKKLEYRGYDSWGIALLKNPNITGIKKVGRIGEFNNTKLLGKSTIGIGHTRWATHGAVTAKNAHPHFSNNKQIAVVHNGIIENYLELKAMLTNSGYKFYSETDTETIPNLIQFQMAKGDSFSQAFKNSLTQLEGSYAMVALNKPEKKLAFARKGSPLVVGIGANEYFVASDVTAFMQHTKKAVYLNDGDYGFISLDIALYNIDDNNINHPSQISWDISSAEKQGYKHFMLKEILEQPEVIKNTLAGRIQNNQVVLEEIKPLSPLLTKVQKITMVSCGTAYHACLVSKYQIEQLVKIPVEVDVSSEFRYRNPILNKHGLVIVISQSGETADTLAALREAKSKGAIVLAVVNVMDSTIAREADYVIYTRAGPEIGVASTKAFISQLVVMTLFTLYMTKLKSTLSEPAINDFLTEIKELSKKVQYTINTCTPKVKEIAKIYKDVPDFLYIARNINYPLAMEGALKLKEISYQHAEAYAAGEMKHGPIALVSKQCPTVAIAAKSETYKKMLSNIQEIKARGGDIIVIATQGDTQIINAASHVIHVPETAELLSPILTTIPMQLLAYYLADARGCEIDKPRNLAKSVTVE
ncbi:MAG: glutamine--fructose-6-phosphate transaminase (isomerizing) [Candidatus Woesearchaeota archaeon]